MEGIMMKKTIILGIGNPILQDDGVGIHVADELKKHIKDQNVTIDHAFTGGMNLLDMIVDHDRAILIDAVKMRDKKPGDVNLFNFGELSAFHTCNPHDVSLPEAIELAEKLGEKRIPKDIRIVGINLGELPCEFGENLSPEIKKAVPKAVKLVEEEVKKNYE
jgi:hydrogenase maturation protease